VSPQTVAVDARTTMLRTALLNTFFFMGEISVDFVRTRGAAEPSRMRRGAIKR
jgi:hypothetical protein